MANTYNWLAQSIQNQPAARVNYGTNYAIPATVRAQMSADDVRYDASQRRKQMMELEEWNNRQKLYDPNNWLTAFGGMSSDASTSSPSAYDARLRSLIDNPDSIANSGAYKFRLDQGNQAIQRSAAAKGMLGSGNTLAELLRYGQGEASQEFGNEVSRLTALRGQDLSLQAQREAANLQARNAFAQMVMEQAFKQAELASKNQNAPAGVRFY